MDEIGKPLKYLYFTYGSNIFSYRTLMKNPTLEFISIARLDNYRLHFITFSKLWGGPTATVVPTANAQVWGVIWKTDTDDYYLLDEDRFSDKNLYIKKVYKKLVKVSTPHMGEITCRLYIQRINPLPRGDNDPIPMEYWPSKSYKHVMILGAIEHGLPEYYIKYLEQMKDNGDTGFIRLTWLLQRYTMEPCECKVSGRIPRKPLKLKLTNAANKKLLWYIKNTVRMD